MHYIYLLQLINHSIYVGRTDNLKRRILEHKQSRVKSTKSTLPVKLIYYEAYLSKKDSIKRELYLKTGDGRKEIRKQLTDILKNK